MAYVCQHGPVRPAASSAGQRVNHLVIWRYAESGSLSSCSCLCYEYLSGYTLSVIPILKLKESDTRFSPLGFFHKSVSHGPLSIPLGPIQIFSKIRGDIRE